ncbi:hypothetical protein SRHO_G00269310, partial [Serrasalmus rhombeus]
LHLPVGRETNQDEALSLSQRALVVHSRLLVTEDGGKPGETAGKLASEEPAVGLDAKKIRKYRNKRTKMNLFFVVTLACALAVESSLGSPEGLTVDPCRPGFSQSFYTAFVSREMLRG